MKVSIEKEESSRKLVEFLESSQNDILNLWEKTVNIDEDDIYKTETRKNAAAMAELIKCSLNHNLPDSDIQKLAHKIAHERAEANINIGDFVYNVNLGRSIIVKYINHSGILIEDLQPIIDQINSQFDRFCYHAVTKYTEIKDEELQEKVLYINDTHKDRLSLLGQISSSFVHEFRNPLTSIMGFIKLLKAGSMNMMYLDIIDHELGQLNFRISQFLHTSKIETGTKKKEVTFIALLVDGILDFLYPSIVDGELEIIKDIPSDIHVKVYEDELNQVLQNLILNSIDAVKLQKKPRKITVSCSEEEEGIKLSISNNGPMIPSGMIESIFDPFYTTKETGTGIGLYVCKKIMEKHNGRITCDSNEMLTTFNIYIHVSNTGSDGT